ncbi:MAG: PEGA domain-containing protein, partial [Blastocatellia bacterium]
MIKTILAAACSGAGFGRCPNLIRVRSVFFATGLLLVISTPVWADRSLIVTSEPSGASISINGRLVGHTPYQEKLKDFWFNGPKYLWSQFLNIPLQMTVTMDGYIPQTITITSGPHRWVNFNHSAEKVFYLITQSSYHIELRKVEELRETAPRPPVSMSTGYIGEIPPLYAGGPSSIATEVTPVEVTSEPPGAEISVDGQAESATPSKLFLRPGGHVIHVARPGFKPWEHQILLLARTKQTLNAQLEA